MKQKSFSLISFNSGSYRINQIIQEVIVAILLVVWLYTGISKLIEWRSFSIQMHQSPVFYGYARVATFAGPILEILLAGLLIFKKSRKFGMIGSFILMSFFSWYVWWLMTHLPNLPCSCGGIVSFLSWPQHLALNVFLSLISLIGIFYLRNAKSSKPIFN